MRENEGRRNELPAQPPSTSGLMAPPANQPIPLAQSRDHHPRIRANHRQDPAAAGAAVVRIDQPQPPVIEVAGLLNPDAINRLSLTNASPSPNPNSLSATPLADDYDSPLRENIKIVVVGDSGVGKSKLVFAQACRRTFSEKELNSCYVPTIWAIDQYKHNREVQEMANTCIDGAHVTIRIWDTFGDHSKNRYFAYQNADVVVLCFSLCDRASLRNVKCRWLKEIRHYLKQVPVILVGTQLDMRWKDLKVYNNMRNKFNRIVSPEDILSPDESRDAYESLCLPYYEATVLTGYGVNEVFENAVRAALVFRRNCRIYTMNHLRKVKEPQLQPPCMPPEPRYPQMPPVPPSTYVSDLGSLFTTEDCANVVLCCGGGGGRGNKKFFCHRLVLVQFSELFNVFFQQQVLMSHMMSESCSDTGGDSDLDSEHNGENRDSSSEIGGVKRKEFFLNGLPVLRIVSSDDCSDVAIDSSSAILDSSHYHIVVHDDIPADHVLLVLYFMYNLKLPSNQLNCCPRQLLKTAKTFLMPDLVFYLENLKEINEGFKNEGSSSGACFHQNLAKKRRDWLKTEFEAQQVARSGDFAFHINDHSFYVHKCILTARSRFMCSLLSGCFREAQGRDLILDDVSPAALRTVLHYLYTDELPDPHDLPLQSSSPSIPQSGSSTSSGVGGVEVEWGDMIELANRLCLDRLIALIEHDVANKIRREALHVGIKHSLMLVEKCSLFNANGLYTWTFTHLSHNYDYMCKNFTYLKQTMLSEETRGALLQNRWPPVWYIKEKDYYERRCRLMAKVEADKRQLRNGMTRWWLWRKQNFV